MDKLIRQRFSELEARASTVYNTDIASVRGWATNVLNLLQRTFGDASVHFKNFDESYHEFTEWQNEFNFRACRGIFQAAKEDYEGGYLFNVRSLVKAEILADDVLEQAKELLNANYKDPACVLAGVALESTLKELCTHEGIAHGKLDRMNADLCKAGVYNMAKQKQITAWAELRNKAAHGDFGQYTQADVDYFIQGVTGFIGDYL